MAVVSFEGLGKRYGPRTAVADISFQVSEREVVGLLGPNGSGKTTLLRILTGYLRPSWGTVRVDGFDVVRDGREARRRIGYVPEDVPLYRHMRVDEFLAFMGRLRGIEGPALQRRIDAALDRFALRGRREAIIGRLSRGYRQRVSLAQAMLHEPRLLVLDEPTNGLDPRQIIELRGLVRTLAEDCAVLVTSHILGEIERIADRVAILLDGRLLAIHSLTRGAGARMLCLRAPANAAARIDAVLAAMPGAVTARREAADGQQRTWHLRAADADAAARLAAALAAAGIATVEVTEAGSDLERLFLDATGGAAPA
jgi:ABC-2 type transport system ATP-binding protein